MAPVLGLHDVRRGFGGVKAVDGVTLAVPEGAIVALIGPNGAGKSTLFALMMGELEPSSGEIRLDGRDMRKLSVRSRVRAGIGRTFQMPRPFAGLSAQENVAISLHARAHVCVARAEVRERNGESSGTAVALREVGLYEQRDALACSLSHGQRKRLELAMVLALQPRVLLLDEPTAGMGVAERAEIMRLVVGIVRRRGLTMVFCEHDMETVFAHAARVVVMDRGVVVADGAPEQVRADPLVQRIYLGDQIGDDGFGARARDESP